MAERLIRSVLVFVILVALSGCAANVFEQRGDDAPMRVGELMVDTPVRASRDLGIFGDVQFAAVQQEDRQGHCLVMYSVSDPKDFVIGCSTHDVTVDSPTLGKATFYPGGVPSRDAASSPWLVIERAP